MSSKSYVFYGGSVIFPTSFGDPESKRHDKPRTFLQRISSIIKNMEKISLQVRPSSADAAGQAADRSPDAVDHPGDQTDSADHTCLPPVGCDNRTISISAE